jgi:DNA-binding GntR family transcriptional regulator
LENKTKPVRGGVGILQASLAIGNEPAEKRSDQAHDRLVDMILAGDLTPGTLLQERALAEGMRISRTPVREALARMEVEGLVARGAGRGYAVREIAAREVMELLHVRALLEREVARLATHRISDQVLSLLRAEVLALMEAAEPTVAGHWAVDDRLHGEIAKATGNTVLADTVRSLRQRTRMFDTTRLPDRFLPGCEEHLMMLEALQERDADAAEAAVARHLDNVKQAILGKLARN